MISTKLVSVVIPMYNAELYIEKMVESIVAQTYQNWELIIVDDNSTDRGCDIVRTFSERYENIILYIKNTNERKGANSSRNIGCKLSSGDYIVFFDADDIITSYCLSQRVAFMENNLNLDFSVFPAIGFKKSAFDLSVNFGYKQESVNLSLFLSGLLPFAVWTNIYKKSSLIDNEVWWDENLPCLQDTDFNILALQKGLKYKFANSAPDYLWRFYGNMNSISRTIYTNKRLEARINLLNKFSYMNLGRKYDSALLLRSYYIYMSLIKSNNSGMCDIFFNAEIFKNHSFLQTKLKCHYLFINKYGELNRFLVLLSLFLFAPIYTFRGIFFNQIRKIQLYILYIYLKLKYKKVVDSSVSY